MKEKPRAARLLAASSLAAAVALTACRKDEPKDKAPTTTGAAGASATTKTAKAPQRELIEVPTEEDFEDTVEKEITPETDLAKALDEIEKQVSAQ